MRKGFSLTELLVVSVIVMLLIGGSVAGMVANKNRRQLKTTAEMVKNQLMEARSYALSPRNTAVSLKSIQFRYYDNAKKTEFYEIQTGGTATLIASFTDLAKNVVPTPVPAGMSSSGTGVDHYYYFEYEANDPNKLGQIVLPVVAGQQSVEINLTDNTDRIKVVVNKVTGNVAIEQVP